MNSVGSSSPMQGSPNAGKSPFKGKAKGIAAGSVQKGSPNRKIIDLTKDDANQDLEKLERDL